MNPVPDTAMTGLAVRPAVFEDLAFLRQVYAGTRADELARAGWDSATCEAFVAQQFEAQRRHYDEHFPRSECGVIEVMVGRGRQPVGRLWVDRRDASIHVLDIAVLPEHRGRGLGTECLRRLMDEATARGVPLTIKVEMFNPARRWYEHLGFEPEDEHGMHVQMAWRGGARAETKETADEQA